MRFSDISWTKDSKGLLLTRDTQSHRRTRCSKPHSPVTPSTITASAPPQSRDVLIYERKDLPAWIINGSVSEDGWHLFVLMFQGAENQHRLYFADLRPWGRSEIDAPIRPLEEKDDAEYLPIGVHGSTLLRALRTRTLRTGPCSPPDSMSKRPSVRRLCRSARKLSRTSPWPAADWSRSISSMCRAGSSMFSLDGKFLADIALPGTRNGRSVKRARRQSYLFGTASHRHWRPPPSTRSTRRRGRLQLEAATPPVDAQARTRPERSSRRRRTARVCRSS